VSAEAQGKEWVLSVADNGIGIAADHMEEVFVIFRRLHTRSEYPGNGIGLSICKKIIEQHGGRIWIESEAGHGSTFRFTLPTRVATS
jgi:light-regulated signal transduction histidine kinase (bacteriophytochrome)